MQVYPSIGVCFLYEIKLASDVKIMKFILQILGSFVIINMKTIC